MKPDLSERLREPLVIEYAVPLPVTEVLQRAADERGEALALIETLAAEREMLVSAVREIEALCHTETRQRLLAICQKALAFIRER